MTLKNAALKLQNSSEEDIELQACDRLSPDGQEQEIVIADKTENLECSEDQEEEKIR